MKIYTHEHLCDFEWLLGEKYRVSHMIRAIETQQFDDGNGDIAKRLYFKYIGVIDEAIKALGYEIADEEAEKLIKPEQKQ